MATGQVLRQAVPKTDDLSVSRVQTENKTINKTENAITNKYA